MSLKAFLVVVAVAAVIALAANGLVAWRQQSVLENDINHLKIDITEIKTDVKWLIRNIKRSE